MRGVIPVTIVSGFLGSGKTTLLCDLMRRRQDRRLAVLINELGEVSIDGALARASTVQAGGASAGLTQALQVCVAQAVQAGVAQVAQADAVPAAQVSATQAAQAGVTPAAEMGAAPPERTKVAQAAGVEIIDFPSGLIAYADDAQFEPTLQAIAARAGQVDHVLIETSGVALPTAAMARLQEANLAGRFVLDATLVIVDTPRLLAGEFDGECSAALAPVRRLFDQQLGAADVVVLNKIDELDADALLAAEEQVRQRAPNVRFMELAHHARLDIRVALGLRLHQSASVAAGGSHFHGPFAPMPGADGRTLADHSRIDGHSHSGLLAHAHGLATHTHFHEQDPGWLSFTLRCVERQSVGVLRTALEQVAETEPLLRCKGFALSSEGETPVLLQGVRARVVATEERAKSSIDRSELVFIGYHLSRARVASMLSRLTGTAWS